MSPSSSPPPLPSEERSTKRRSNDSLNPALDESISPLDPRRFTPTLHASLVSEILSLRRDLENKTKDIDQLETTLHSTREENETLNENLLSSHREARTMKRQMQLLEGGTMTALNDIARERDEANKDVADLRRRLDQSQKRAKSHEDNAERTQLTLGKEREAWFVEKRALETQVHIVEGRLKVVLSEVVNSQPTSAPIQNGDHARQQRGSFPESPGKRPMSALSLRRLSGASNHSDHFGSRISAMGHMNGVSTSLADELALEEEDEARDEFPEDGRISPDALPEERERPTSRLSVKAHKILGLSSGIDEFDSLDSPKRQKPFGLLNGLNQHPTAQTTTAHDVHADAALQQLPPSSPASPPVLAISAILKTEVVPRDPVPALYSAPKASSIEPIAPVNPIRPGDMIDSHDAQWQVSSTKSAPVMTSTSCQTIDQPSNPPSTPEMANSELGAVPDIIPGRLVMTSISTQTDLIDEQPVSDESRTSFEDVRKLPIPTIAIIPPASRPATPETSVVLPPRTKNAGCQVNLPSYAEYNSLGTQTEDIKPDLPRITTSSLMSQYKLPSSGKTVPSNSSRRRFPQTAPPSTLYDSKRAVIAEEPFYAPDNDTGPLAKDFASDVNRPARSSSLFAGFDDLKEDEFAPSKHDVFDEDDIFSRPIAKFTVRSGKLVSQEGGLEDIGEVAAASAGEAVALENLRMSEDGLPPELRANLSGRVSPRKSVDSGSRSYKLGRRVSSPKRNNIRRNVLIHSGTAAHSAHSSIRSSQDLPTPTDGGMAPFPVPIRFSSARIGKSASEGGRSSPVSSAASPTKRDKQFRNRKPLLRKVRSGPAVSPGPNDRRPRSRSPPNPRVSIVPEMPSFRMPTDNASIRTYQQSEASAPRPSIATGPNRNTSHTKTNSDAVSMQQTSVVDAIAQTMIGEWMFKYVRRRKSFGMPESKAVDYDPTKNADEISATVTSNGVRHKRWVWLAPYERAVMWSSKQPMSNWALLGKAGRKLTIQSVLDVKDDNPMPKGSISGPHFNRSILILTPQRALKFTSLSQERHYIWLTALSFLSHSPLSLGDLATLPLPTSDIGLPPANLTGSHRRRPIRDSIRIAKSTGRAGLRSFTTDGSLPVHVHDMDRAMAQEEDYYDPMTDSAWAPTVPRLSMHSRQRSNTAPRAPQSSFKSFTTRERESVSGSGHVPSLPGVGSTYSQSIGTGVGSERMLYTPSLGIRSVGSKSSSRRGSEASAVSGARPNAGLVGMHMDSGNGSGAGPPNATGNGASAIGSSGSNATANWTMRMDAFIETKGTPPKTQQGPGVGGLFNRARHYGKRKDLGYWGLDEDRSESPSMGAGIENILLPGDPLGSTTTGFGGGYGYHQRQEVEVGAGDPFRGF